jgi:carbamoylphosphate synthase large subunit
MNYKITLLSQDTNNVYLNEVAAFASIEEAREFAYDYMRDPFDHCNVECEADYWDGDESVLM